ncbi:ABC transporter ATP-binding protein [Robertmurraya andreesenii]|uniref:ABC-2 type transport system ATP-binding protein n=1 Tax=Anoxybacillus andreesenii TaxID=1325932 RepID=A0ABT9V471_9BACL|nr:ABC transporter ATP-binding protein [Robertmurraya andreesenii]MDQ0155735.1 ABC-2 type transport system ATP-binding protein [Robertmurraya andreesenii]
MLKLKDISVIYKDKTVLNKLSLTAEKGEIIGLVAPNGTGKTTLFNVIANFLKPNSGSVTFLDQLEYKTEKDELSIRKILVSFPDQGDLFDELTGVDHLNLYASMWKGTTRHIPEVIEQLRMTGYVKKKVRTYSLGMRQRLCFAMMMAADTPIMLMDEVMNGLDISNVALISQQLMKMKQEEKLIFVASHLLENLDLYADRVLYLKAGGIIHQQSLDESTALYIKIDIDREQYERLSQEYKLPDDHLFIANHLCCIPIDQMDEDEQSKWIERFLASKVKELTVGPLGTMELYEKFYVEM